MRAIVDYHNFALTQYYRVEAVDYDAVLAQALALGDQIKPMIADITDLLHTAREAGEDIMFEGAQGSLLDIDHGTYPFVTSSNTTAGGTATGSGFGPLYLDYVLGITKAYTTRVGSGPFPTELSCDIGEYLGKRATSSVLPRVASVVPVGSMQWRFATRCALTVSAVCV